MLAHVLIGIVSGFFGCWICATIIGINAKKWYLNIPLCILGSFIAVAIYYFSNLDTAGTVLEVALTIFGGVLINWLYFRFCKKKD